MSILITSQEPRSVPLLLECSTDNALRPQACKIVLGNPGQLPEDFIGVLPQVRSRARIEHAVRLREPQR